MYVILFLVSLSFQGTEEVQVPTEPQAGVQFGARGTNGRVSLLHSSLCGHFYVGEIIEYGLFLFQDTIFNVGERCWQGFFSGVEKFIMSRYLLG